MIPLKTPLKTLILVPTFIALGACGKKATDRPAVAAGSAVQTSARALPDAPKLVKTVAFQCASGGRLELHEYDDKLTRATISGQEHVLSTVTVDGGSLLQGDNISIRLFDDQATASENGVVLYAGCKSAP